MRIIVYVWIHIANEDKDKFLVKFGCESINGIIIGV